MIVLVCGGRDFNDREKFFKTLDKIRETHKIDRIVHGGASGADSLAGEYAMSYAIPCQVFLADWTKHGRSAGPIRNKKMLSEANPNLVVAFPGGRGTNHMTSIATEAGVAVFYAERSWLPR